MKINHHLALVAFGLLVSVVADRGVLQEASAQSEPWRTSWSAFTQATKDFLDQELREHPEKPEFPQAGSILLSAGEMTKPDLPIMKKFGGPLQFKGRLAEVIAVPTATDSLMPGQPFKLRFEMTEPGVQGWLLRPTHVYPKAGSEEKWKAIAVGTEVTFRSQLTGIGALGIPGRYFCMVLLTEAEPVDAKP